MNDTILHTGRLNLIPATCDILTADLESRAELGLLLNAAIPVTWPPALLDKDVLREFIRMRKDTKGPLCMTWYWVINEPGTGERTLIGTGGIVQSGDSSSVMLGYSVLPPFQNRGYATEAVRALVQEIFLQPGIREILATTFPTHPASIRVLEKSGFLRTDRILSGSGAEEGTVCYLLERE
jgi:[ribosomal protein S5]-alanine N-acetyltransferase